VTDQPNIESKKPLRIAFIGTRGVPAVYGGFETCVEEIGKRLVQKGHEITVYCRKSYYQERYDEYLGMNLIYLTNIRKKSLDTLSHTFFSIIHALFRSYDIYMVFNSANSPLLFPLKLFRKNIVVNTDGHEWQRTKWGFWGKSYYKISERIACILASKLISDSRGIKEYFLETYSADSSKIAYGANPVNGPPEVEYLNTINVEPNEYFLQVTRFEPENHPLLTIRAFKKLKSTKKLILVGGNSYPNKYTQQMDKEADDNIILPGFIYDRDVLNELWTYCYAYIHGNSVGGTNPALLQSMACGCLTIAYDNKFNREVLTDCGIYFQGYEESLLEKMQWVIDHKSELTDYKKKARDRIDCTYSWVKVTNQYERLFHDVKSGKYP